MNIQVTNKPTYLINGKRTTLNGIGKKIIIQSNFGKNILRQCEAKRIGYNSFTLISISVSHRSKGYQLCNYMMCIPGPNK